MEQVRKINMIRVEKNKLTREFFLVDGKKQIEGEAEEILDKNGESTYYLTLWKNNDFDSVLEDIFNDSRILGIECPLYRKWKGINVSASVDFDDGYFGVVKVFFDNHWRWNFSPQDYFTELSRIRGNGIVDVEFDEEDSLITSIRVFLRGNEDVSLASKEFHEIFAVIHKYHLEAIQRLVIGVSDNSLLSSFNFPNNIKSSCEQYLLYFAQFLQDLGINATSDLKEEAEKVLFSVTPTDDVEALDKIREALAVYLNLPSSPIEYNESFAAMRLQQQVENLQHSQKMAVREIRSAERELRLAQTVIEHQDKIIYQKDSIIEQQNKVIEKIQSKSIMMDSLENKEEFEKVFEGLEVGESKILKEQIGIRFNPVTSLKTLGKKLIGKDDERKSVLGLDEET